jgi:sulfate adenylyltransferase subunit 1 (EFTu-like GTPase family)
MVDTPLRTGTRLWFKHGTRTGRATLDEVRYVHDVDTLDKRVTPEVGLNDLASVRVSFSEPVVAAPYAHSRVAGRLILVDEATNVTAGALVVTEVG